MFKYLPILNKIAFAEKNCKLKKKSAPPQNALLEENIVCSNYSNPYEILEKNQVINGNNE